MREATRTSTTSRRKYPRSCGARFRRTTARAGSPPGCTASRSTSRFPGCAAKRRRRSIRYDAGLHEPVAEEIADDDEGRRILRGFIDSQDALNRAVLLLYLEEHSCAEMSEILGVTETNLTTKIHRLKDRLRAYAEKHHGTR
jgi:hypothetical protein